MSARRSETDEVVTLRRDALIQEWTELQNWIGRNGSLYDDYNLSCSSFNPKRINITWVKSLVRSLTNILGDADEGARRSAAMALGGIGPAHLGRS